MILTVVFFFSNGKNSIVLKKILKMKTGKKIKSKKCT